MEIDLPLYSPPGLSDCGTLAGGAFDSSAFRLPADAACCLVKTEEADEEDDFLKDILDLPDTACALSPADSGCPTGQSTPAYRCDFAALGLSPPQTPLNEAEEEEVDGLVMQQQHLAMSGPAVTGVTRPSELSDYELVSLSIKDLNVRLRHLPKQRVLQLKHRRRTLKNRQYAHVCRQRRQQSHAEMATETVGLARQIAALRHQLDRVSRERDHFRDELRRARQLAHC